MITFSAKAGTFTNKINLTGVIEAKKSTILKVPEIWPAPKISTLAKEGTKVKKGDIVVTFEAEQIQRNYLNALEKLDLSKSEAVQKEEALRLERMVLELNAKIIEASAEIARLQVSKLKFAAQTKRKIMEIEIKIAETRLKKIRKKLKALNSIQNAEKRRMEMELKKAKNEVERCKLFLDRLILKAPTDGIVIHEINRSTRRKVKAGETLWGDLKVANIPELDTMQVKCQVREVNIKKIKTDQAATIVTETFPDSVLSGRVTKVGSVGKPIERDSKIKAFEVIIEIDGHQPHLFPGISATIEIVTNQIDSVVAIPQESIFEKDSINFVYIQKADKYLPQQVQIEYRDPDFVYIKDSLKNNDIVALSEPDASIQLELKYFPKSDSSKSVVDSVSVSDSTKTEIEKTPKEFNR